VIALSNALAEAQTSLMASQLSGGFIRLFSGTRPTSADKAEAGVLLGIVTVAGLAGAGLHYAAGGAVLQKAAEPWVFRALADGVVSWFRVVATGDTGGNDLSALRLDGDVGTPAAPGDMTWKNTAVSNGVVYTLDTFIYLIQPIGNAS
jgi:hypothetical protein